MGISSKIDADSSTPPPSPAEFNQNGGTPIDESKLPPTAVQEQDDFHHNITNNSIKIVKESSPVKLIEDVEQEVVRVLDDIEIIMDDDNEDEEEEEEEDYSKSDSQKFIKEESRIPVAAKTSTPIKVKTIKKHSKVTKDIKKQPVSSRPTVGDIEWEQPASPPSPQKEQSPQKERSPQNEQSPQKQRSPQKEQSPQKERSPQKESPKKKEKSPKKGKSPPKEQSPQKEVAVVKNDEPIEISSLQLEDITAQNNMSSDPTILNNDYSSNDEIVTEVEHLVKSIKTKKMTQINPDGSEIITIITETQGPDGEVVVSQETINTTAEQATELKNRGNSESDSDNFDVQQKSLVTQSQSQSSTKGRTIESSSGSDVALHEPGTELSDDETGEY